MYIKHIILDFRMLENRFFNGSRQTVTSMTYSLHTGGTRDMYI